MFWHKPFDDPISWHIVFLEFLKLFAVVLSIDVLSTVLSQASSLARRSSPLVGFFFESFDKKRFSCFRQTTRYLGITVDVTTCILSRGGGRGRRREERGRGEGGRGRGRGREGEMDGGEEGGREVVKGRRKGFKW